MTSHLGRGFYSTAQIVSRCSQARRLSSHGPEPRWGWSPPPRQPPRQRRQQLPSAAPQSQPRPKSRAAFVKAVGYLRRHNERPLPSRAGSEFRKTARKVNTKASEAGSQRTRSASLEREDRLGNPGKSRAPSQAPKLASQTVTPETYALSIKLQKLIQSFESELQRSGNRTAALAHRAEAAYAEGRELVSAAPKQARRSATIYSQLIRLALTANRSKEAMNLVLELKKNALTPTVAVFNSVFRGLAVLEPPLESTSEVFTRARRLFEEFDAMRLEAFDVSTGAQDSSADVDPGAFKDKTAALRASSHMAALQYMRENHDKVARVMLGWAQLLSAVGHQNECVQLWDYFRAKTRFEERNGRRVLVHTPPYPHATLFTGMLSLYAYTPDPAKHLHSAEENAPNLHAVTTSAAIKAVWDDWQDSTKAALASNDRDALERLAMDEYGLRKLFSAAEKCPDPTQCLFVLDVLKEQCGIHVPPPSESHEITVGANEQGVESASAILPIKEPRTVETVVQYLLVIEHYSGAVEALMQFGFRPQSAQRFPELHQSGWLSLQGNHKIIWIIKSLPGHGQQARAILEWLHGTRDRHSLDLRAYESAVRVAGWTLHSETWSLITKIWAMLVADRQAGKLGSEADLLVTSEARHGVPYATLLSARLLYICSRSVAESQDGSSRQTSAKTARECLRMIHDLVGGADILGSEDVHAAGRERGYIPSVRHPPTHSRSAPPTERAQDMYLWLAALLKEATSLALDSGPSGADLVSRQEKDRWTLLSRRATEALNEGNGSSSDGRR